MMPRSSLKSLRSSAGLQPVLPRWRWLVYLGTAMVVFFLVFGKVGGSWPHEVFSLNAWKASTQDGEAILITGVFGGLIMALVKLFLDPVFLGIAQRRSRLELAGELATTIALTAAGVAGEGLLQAAASATGSEAGDSDASSVGSASAGGGGTFGGGGASGRY